MSLLLFQGKSYYIQWESRSGDDISGEKYYYPRPQSFHSCYVLYLRDKKRKELFKTVNSSKNLILLRLLFVHTGTHIRPGFMYGFTSHVDAQRLRPERIQKCGTCCSPTILQDIPFIWPSTPPLWWPGKARFCFYSVVFTILWKLDYLIALQLRHCMAHRSIEYGGTRVVKLFLKLSIMIYWWG